MQISPSNSAGTHIRRNNYLVVDAVILERCSNA